VAEGHIRPTTPFLTSINIAQQDSTPSTQVSFMSYRSLDKIFLLQFTPISWLGGEELSNPDIFTIIMMCTFPLSILLSYSSRAQLTIFVYSVGPRITPFVTLMAGALAVPSPSLSLGPGDVSSVVQYLDSNNNLVWKDFENGRYVQLPEDDEDNSASGGYWTPVETTSRRWEPFESVGQISDMATQVACIGSGISIEGSKVSAYIADACSAFLSEIPGATFINSAWKVYQVANVANNDGVLAVINFRWKSFGSQPPKLTDTMCNKGLSLVSQNLCVEEDDETQGATLQIGSKGSGIQIGFDPNTQ